MTRHVHGALAIVTGHSRGLGAGIARALLERDVPVIAVSRARNQELAKRFSSALTEYQVDLADRAALVAWLDSGGLQRGVESVEQPMLVNNAGLLQPIGPLETQKPGDVLQTVGVNVAAPLALAAAFVQATEAARDRRILHISSGAGRKAYAGWSVYCATKAALDHHARCVVLDRTPRLRITSLAPSVIDTDMQAEIRASTLAQFPERDRFIGLKRDGKLNDPYTRGCMIADLLLSDGFGDDPIMELPR